MKRLNKDIKYVVIHSTGLISSITGSKFNDVYNRGGYFGMPQDIFINPDGGVDLSPRWINAQSPAQFQFNVRLKDIILKYTYHHPSGTQVNSYNKNSIHICVGGNFDRSAPTMFQKQKLLEVLGEISLRLSLDMNTALLYFSDIFETTSPGAYFFNKTELFINKSRVIELPVVSISEIGGYGNIYGGNDVFGYGQVL